MKIINSNIVTTFGINTIGTKVVDGPAFMNVLEEAVKEHDFDADRVPGQGFIPLPKGTTFVTSGVGKRTTNPEDYVARLYRGRVSLFLKRELAAPVESLACIVYTTKAYLADPDVLNDLAEFTRVRRSEATHVLVAILASAGPKAPLTPGRFVANLAGGNKEAELWGADEIRAKAKEVAEYASTWCVVAD